VTTHCRIRIGTIAVAAVTTSTLLLAGCSSTSSNGTSTTSAAPTTSATAAVPVNVVASTNVWGDITKQIGGDHVNVTSILSDPNADPHQYEADAKTGAAISKAQLVVDNAESTTLRPNIRALRSATPNGFLATSSRRQV
jgi:zinc/manganese transport system substrate-binding protein